MKPRINRKIYVIYRGQISEETVRYLGEDSFIVEHYADYITNCEFRYDNYNKVWFTSLSKAKAKVRGFFPNEKLRFIECKDRFTNIRFWEVE